MIQKPYTNLSQNGHLVRRTRQMKEQVTEAVVYRLQFLKIS